jgi:hypothetical protein
MVTDVQVVAIVNQDRQAPYAGKIQIELDRRVFAGQLSRV